MTNTSPVSNGQKLNVQQAMALAAQYQSEGRLGPAEAVLRQILAALPTHGPALHLLGVVAHQAGQSETAIRLVRDAITQNPNVGLFHTNLCEMLRQAGQLEAAIAAGRNGTRLDPGSAIAHSNLGVALYDAGDYESAEASQMQALEIDGNVVQALNNLGSIKRQQEDRDAATELYRRALEVAPNHLEALNNLGAILSEQQRTEEARSALLRAVQLRPDYAEAHRNLGSVFLQEEDLKRARVAFGEALRISPDFVDAQIGLANVAREEKDYAHASSLLDSALARDPESTSALVQLGMLESDLGYVEKALTAYDRAIEFDPSAQSPKVAKAHLLIEHGDMDAAETVLQTVFAEDPDALGGHLAWAQLKKISVDDQTRLTLEKELDSLPDSAVTKKIPIFFALGKCLDDAGEYEAAMAHYLKGCALKRERIQYDPEGYANTVDDIIKTFDEKTVARLSEKGHASALPVLVLGMPRSGTTLTEQIIASHSRVHGAGELPDLLDLAGRSALTGEAIGFPASIANITPQELDSLGIRYCEGLRQRNPDAEFVTDKMPANFQAIGLIHLMLPNATIIHVKRDPVDTCVSNISKLFKNGQTHSYDLREMGHYYRQYDRLMQHWRKVLPADAFYEIRYEELVADTETEAKKLIDACKLEWEPACLDFHKTERSIRTASVTQVRQPIYQTSVAKWKRYESALQPLLEALGDLVIQ